MNTFKILPHSYPFAFVDKIIEIAEGERVICLRNITVNEEYLMGHFKDNPVFPFSLVIESMAQTCGLLLRSGTSNDGKLAYLAAIRDAKFIRHVMTGEEMTITAVLTKSLSPLHIFDSIVSVKGETVSEAEIILSDAGAE